MICGAPSPRSLLSRAGGCCFVAGGPMRLLVGAAESPSPALLKGCTSVILFFGEALLIFSTA
jgi:hypothetical protein